MFAYAQALKQLNNSENIYGREIGMLNGTINNERIRSNELINKIQKLGNTEQGALEIIEKLNEKIDKLENKKKLI